jgi:hypothetical protein
MTYTLTTLKQAIQDYVENDETTFVNNLDNFIQNTEERLLKLVDLDYFRKNVSANMTASNKFLSLPSDYLATFSLSFVKNGENIFLLQKDVNFLQEYTPDPTVTGEPKYYGIFDVDNFILAPTPDQSYSAELHYYYRPASITSTVTGTSWFGDNAPDALLYGCLTEAYTFMKGEPTVIQMYEKRFVEAVTRLKIYAEGVENTDAYRIGLTRVPKQ